MPNEMVTVSQHVMELRKERAEALKKVTDAAKAGLFAGALPSIGCKGTRFVVKDGPNVTVLDVLRIKGIIISAKIPFDKVFYLNNYKEGDENAPDCYSKDGVRPDAQASLKQNAACAGCPRNVFGTAKDKDGNPTGGKACSDYKVVAITVGERNEDNTLKCYQLRIPPASLSAWNKYVNELEQHDAYLPEVITEIGFNPKVSYPQLTFTMAGTVPDEVIGDVYVAMDSAFVKSLVADTSPAPAPAEEKVIEAQAEEVKETPAEEKTTDADNTFGNLTLATPKEGAKKTRPAKAKDPEVLPKEEPKEEKKEEVIKQEPAFGGFSDADLKSKLGL